MTGSTVGRDYKHLRRTNGRWFSGWTGLFIGLAIGLTVALGVPSFERGGSSVALRDVAVEDSTTAHVAEDYSFPDILEKGDAAATPSGNANGTASAAAVGPVVLQAGWFRRVDDAEKLHGRLAQHGVTARIQRLEVDDETWYRLRIGPIETAQEIKDIRARLDEAQVQATPVTRAQWGPQR